MQDLNSPEGARTNTARIEQALKNLQEFGAQGRFPEFWDHAINVEEMFMLLKPTLEDNFERLWFRYCKICDSTRQQEAALQQQAKENAARIEREIQRLSRFYVGHDAESAVRTHRYGPNVNWAHIAAVQKMFESLPLPEEDRERLWASYSSVHTEARKIQDQQLEESARNRQSVQALVGETLSRVEASKGIDDLSEARAMLRQVFQQLKESYLSSEDGDHCWSYWREANNKALLKQREFQTAAYSDVKKGVDQWVQDASEGDPYVALTGIQDTRRNLHRLPLAREQREELGRRLTNAWQKATTRIAEIREERQRRHQEWQQREEERKLKQQQWQQMMVAKVEEWEGYTKEASEEVASLEQDILGLQEEAHNATRVEYARVLKSLIEQKQKEIQKLKQQIGQWQSRIDEVRATL